jgi:hypothetical protein|tara:strand:- start:1258 stop:1458 length:201 start_codon:yes stop_codon:yes gene_type:complete
MYSKYEYISNEHCGASQTTNQGYSENRGQVYYNHNNPILSSRDQESKSAAFEYVPRQFGSQMKNFE